MTDLGKWLGRNAKERGHLYEMYGKPLEEAHRGEFLAIGFDGRTVLGKDDGEVLKKAIEDLGSGNFVLAQVGHLTFGKWLKLNNKVRIILSYRSAYT